MATLLSTAALADTRIFIIENSDGYGVDGCLASGAPCSEQVASAWCRTHDYSRALDFGEVANPATKGRSLIGGSAALPPTCAGPDCAHQVAITCSR